MAGDQDNTKGSKKAWIYTGLAALIIVIGVVGTILFGGQAPLYMALAATPIFMAVLVYLAVTPDPDA